MKVLALDIGSAQIKAVILEAKFGRFDLVYHEITPVSDFLEPVYAPNAILSQGQLIALQEVCQKHITRVDKTIVNSPHSIASTRFQSFPLKDKKKVRAAIQFAIEDEIPFNAEDCTISSMFRVNTKGKESSALIALSPNESLTIFIQQLQSVGLDPETISVDQSGFWHLFSKHKNLYSDKGIAIANFGHRKSQLMLFRQGDPVLLRTTLIGGWHLTNALAKKYDISLAEAEVIKREQAFFPQPGQNLNNDQKIFTETLAQAFLPILNDFDQSLMAFSSRYNESIQQILICGGGSAINGLQQMLSARWEQKIQPFSLLAHMPNISIRPQPLIESTIATAACLSLTHTKNEFSNLLNLRSGKFKPAYKAHSIHWENYVRPIKLASIIYVFALLSFIGQYFFLGQQLEQVGIRQDQAITEIFGKSTSSFLLSLKSSDAKLKQQVQKKVDELSSQLTGGGETRSIPTLDILDGFSRAIPKSTTVEIREFKLSNGQLQLKLESPSQKDLENALRLISSAPRISAPQVLPIENLSGGRKRVLVNAKITGGNT